MKFFIRWHYFFNFSCGYNTLVCCATQCKILLVNVTANSNKLVRLLTVIGGGNSCYFSPSSSGSMPVSSSCVSSNMSILDETPQNRLHHLIWWRSKVYLGILYQQHFSEQFSWLPVEHKESLFLYILKPMFSPAHIYIALFRFFTWFFSNFSSSPNIKIFQSLTRT